MHALCLLPGAPVVVAAENVPGYVAQLGASYSAGRYNFDCAQSFKRGFCMLVGRPQVCGAGKCRCILSSAATRQPLAAAGLPKHWASAQPPPQSAVPQDLASACNADPRCVGFSAFPLGSSNMMGVPLGYLLQGGAARRLDLSWASLNPMSILYMNASTLPARSPSATSPSPPPPAASPPPSAAVPPPPATSAESPNSSAAASPAPDSMLGATIEAAAAPADGTAAPIPASGGSEVASSDDRKSLTGWSLAGALSTLQISLQ